MEAKNQKQKHTESYVRNVFRAKTPALCVRLPADTRRVTSNQNASEMKLVR